MSAQQVAPRDVKYMRRALMLAAQARGQTLPNPMVGAVVVAGDVIVGEGYHRRAGCAHAEPVALAAAKGHTNGASLYVTLEPCHHTGRTGPCTTAIVEAGIRRVVVGAADNDARVCGRGIQYLRAQGITVDCGVEQATCARLNLAYHHLKATGRAFVSSIVTDEDARGRAADRFQESFLQTVNAVVVAPHRRLRITHKQVLFDARDPAWKQWAAQRCDEGDYHVCIVQDDTLVKSARAQGALCRELRIARHQPFAQADWSKALDRHRTVWGRWHAECKRALSR